jgi:hypothetical protein
MKIRYLFLGLAMTVCMASSFAQVNGTWGPLTWKIENDTLTISGNGDMPDVYMAFTGPWCIDNGSSIYCPFRTVIIEDGVTSIGKSAFVVSGIIASISIPNSLTKIGEGAFAGSLLYSIVIPSSVTKIGGGVFYDCIELTTVTLPNRAIDFGGYVFGRCTKLISITNPNPVPQVINLDVFNEFNISACTLYVPKKAVPAYKKAEVWKEFIIIGADIGTEEFENTQNQLFIYPNPTAGTCNIILPEEFLDESSLTLSIYDAGGVLVQQIQLNSNDEIFDFDLNIKAKGVYIATLSNGEKKYTGKIVFE